MASQHQIEWFTRLKLRKFENKVCLKKKDYLFFQHYSNIKECKCCQLLLWSFSKILLFFSYLTQLFWLVSVRMTIYTHLYQRRLCHRSFYLKRKIFKSLYKLSVKNILFWILWWSENDGYIINAHNYSLRSFSLHINHWFHHDIYI